MDVDKFIFVEILNIEELVDCENVYYSGICQNPMFILDSNPKNLELPLMFSNEGNLKVKIGAQDYSEVEEEFFIEKNKLNTYEVLLTLENEKIENTSVIKNPSCKTFGFDEGELNCLKEGRSGQCLLFDTSACFKERNFKEVWSKNGWDNQLEGTAEFDTYAPFYYKRECNGLIENCVGSTIEFTSGEFSGQSFEVKGFGKNLSGETFEMNGISWIEIDTNIEFGTYNDSTQIIPFKSIDWNYKLFGSSREQTLPSCGNGVVEGNEECDGNVVYESCSELGFVAGSVSCNKNCTYNTNSCAPNLVDCNGLGKTCVITACEQLPQINNFRHRTDANAIGGNYVLGNDIDCSGIDIPMIGEDRSVYTFTRQFKGNFDGNGHTISGVNYYRQYSGRIADQYAGPELWWENIYVGLFKYIGASGRVQNLTLSDVNVTGAVKVGGLAGASEGTIWNTKVSGNVKGTRQIGGIVGVSEGLNGGRIEFSRFDGIVTGKNIDGADTGSIIGYCLNGLLISPKTNSIISPVEERKFFGKNVNCKLQHTISYDAFIFNGANAPLLLKLDGEIARTPYYDTNKLVTIHDASDNEVLVEFVHDFSKDDLDLKPVTVTMVSNYLNKNILFVNNLKVQETKTMFLQKLRPISKGVCVLNSEVEDVNQLLRECTKLLCPSSLIIGDSNVSCTIDENKFTVFGLKYSGIVEEWECGDGWCDVDETSLSCPLDCNEFCGNNICGVGENTNNCPTDCPQVQPQTNTGSSSSSGGSGWTTRAVICTSNLSCGNITFIGERYCSENIVYQKAKIPTCVNPSRTDSNCVIIEKDLNIMTCETGQVCASGKCIVERVDYDSIACTTNIGCSGTQECSVGYCKDIVCEEGYYPKEHKCFCEGVHCTAKLTEENNFADENLSTEETASFDWFSLLFWLFILLLFLLIIGILIWFFIIKKKKKEGIPTESKQSFF